MCNRQGEKSFSLKRERLNAQSATVLNREYQQRDGKKIEAIIWVRLDPNSHGKKSRQSLVYTTRNPVLGLQQLNHFP